MKIIYVEYALWTNSDVNPRTISGIVAARNTDSVFCFRIQLLR